jgi:DNA-binding response OmpR family regulator
MNVTQSTSSHAERYQDLHLSVDFERETALLDGTRMKLTYKAFALLAFLVRHPGQLIPRDTLLMLVWGYGAEIRTRTLDVHIRRLRKSLGNYGNAYIETVFGVGYRFQPCRAQSAIEAPDTSPALALGATAAASQWRWKTQGNTPN